MPPMMNQKPKGPKNWGKLSKTLSFWVLITLLAGTLFTYTSGSRDAAPTIKYSEYVKQLDEGNIASVTIQDGSVIIGDLKNKIPVERRMVGSFRV